MDTSKDFLHADYDWAIEYSRMTLQFFGLWPKVNENWKRKFIDDLQVCGGFILMMCFLIIPEFWSLVRVRDDLMLVVDNLQISLSITSAVLKYSIFCWKKEDVSELVIEVENDWLKWKSVEEKDTMIKQAQLTRKLTMSVYCLIVFTWLVLHVPPCFGLNMRYITNFTDPGEKTLAIQSYFFYDLTKSFNFLITYTLQATTLLYVGMSYTGIDCFIALLVLHVCGQLENLKMHLMNLTNFKNIRDEFSFCVQEHVRIIRFIRIVDNIVNIMLLVHLFMLVVLTCLQGFLFMKVVKEGGDLPILRFVWLAIAIFTVLVHIFVYCVVGEILVMCCEEMYEAAYNNEWYILKADEAKMLLLILIRARPPLYITAGKMFPMTLETFCNVIKTSVSYVSVLLAMF